MNKALILIAVIFLFAIAACTTPPKKNADAASLYKSYCGSCHLVPDPANMPKAIWRDHVLPEMAARLGHSHNGYSPFANNSMEENLHIRLSNTYPKSPLIDSVSWRQLHDFVIAQAPENIPVDSTRSIRNKPLTQFTSTPLSLDKNWYAGITYVEFEPASHQFIIGDAFGVVHRWPVASDASTPLLSPVVARHQNEAGTFLTEIGYMNPSERSLGILQRIGPVSTDTLAQNLHRPVFTEVVDLNGNGKDEILICEFGNLSGELSLWVDSGSKFEKKSLLSAPGTIKVDIVDMNKDGKKDIVVLASQGNEGIFILYQNGNLAFELEHVIKMGSEYGSSWFELIDYNGDNHMDVILANGDNADYSIFPKPYHGIRLFLNDGKNGFEEKWFYPIYGATRVLAEDYDLDGDVDFAVAAFFPDFDHSPDESFVFLENKNAEEYLFESYTLPGPVPGRWMVMEDGDFDQDGDVDIMLGSFILPLNKKYNSLMERWRSEKVDVVVLENGEK